MAEFLKQNNSGFSSINVNNWEGGSSSTDKHVTSKIKKQHRSSLDEMDLEYDEEKIALADRKFKKREKNKAEKKWLAKQNYGKKQVNVFRRSIIGGIIRTLKSEISDPKFCS